MPYEPPPYLASLTLAEIAEAGRGHASCRPYRRLGIPRRSATATCVIAADGTWFHEGTRDHGVEAMVRAFASPAHPR
jgi:hypothetical protein